MKNELHDDLKNAESQCEEKNLELKSVTIVVMLGYAVLAGLFAVAAKHWSPSFWFIAGWGALSLIAWLIFLFSEKYGRILVALALLPPSGLYLFQAVRRIAFIIKNRALDSPNGDSPLAFLIDMIGEQVFLLPAVVLLVWMVAVWAKGRKIS